MGLQGGIARHDGSLSVEPGLLSGNQLIDEKKIGGTVGGLLGYNWQQDSFVYGLEGDWNWIGGRTSRFASAIDHDNNSLSTSYEVNWLSTFRGRAGLALDGTLLYVTGGLAFGHAKNDVALIDRAADTQASFTENRTKIGWTAGVGVEHMFSQHWTARAEFRYVDLGKTSIACAVSGGPDFNGCIRNGYRGEFSNTLKLGLVGLAYKF